MFLDEKLQRVQDDLTLLDDPHERLATLVDRSRRVTPLPAEEKVDANRVHGCVSVVWLVGERRGGRCYFRGDAESPLVRALIVFLCDFFSGAPVRELAASTMEPLEALGVSRNLTPTRRNGLAAARAAIRDFALTSAESATDEPR